MADAPRERLRRDLRASHADRERAVDFIRRHAVEGRLTTEELEERVGLALRARTLGDLDDLVVDLPPEPVVVPAPPPPRRRPFAGSNAVRFAAIGLILLGLSAPGHGAVVGLFLVTFLFASVVQRAERARHWAGARQAPRPRGELPPPDPAAWKPPASD